MANKVKRGKFTIVFSTKHDGNMSFKYGEAKEVSRNRKKLFNNLGLHENDTLFLSPHHSNSVSTRLDEHTVKIYNRPPVVEGDFDGFIDGIDGHLTTLEKPIAVLTGDCVPLIVYHKRSNLHGIIHVGLLGVVNNIVNNLKNIFADLDINPSEVGIYMGPSIKQNSYNLKYSGLWSGIKNKVGKNASFIKEFIKVSDNSVKINLQAIIKSQLINIGANLKRIEINNNDTANTDSEYYSHFASRLMGVPEGRFFSIIYLK